MNTIGLNPDSLAHADGIRAGHHRDGKPVCDLNPRGPNPGTIGSPLPERGIR